MRFGLKSCNLCTVLVKRWVEIYLLVIKALVFGEEIMGTAKASVIQMIYRMLDTASVQDIMAELFFQAESGWWFTCA